MASTLSPSKGSSFELMMDIYGISQLKRNSIIKAVTLSAWDNILGPKLIHLWKTENCSVEQNTLNYISVQTLNAEICRDITKGYVDTKFYMLAEKGWMVLSYIFGAMSKTGVAVHSLAVVMKHEDLKVYLAWRKLMDSWLRRYIGKIRILMEKSWGKGPSSDSYIHALTEWLTEFETLLHSLELASIADNIQLCDTFLDAGDEKDEDFLRRAISSHLCTCGNSIVLGKSDEKINKMIATLALFNTSSERKCSRYMQSDSSWPYHHDICVQGVRKDSNGHAKLPIREIQCSLYPTTLIDLVTKDVKQSPPVNDHNCRRFDILKNEITCLALDRSDTSYPMSTVFQSFEHPESLVKTFLTEVLQLHPACGVREAYVEQFARQIERKALAMIKYVEMEKNLPRYFPKRDLKKLKQDLQVHLEGDFRIVLATAEKLKPGFYTFILGDPRADDTMKKELLSNF